jgi:hypothetical protein
VVDIQPFAVLEGVCRDDAMNETVFGFAADEELIEDVECWYLPWSK